MLLGLVIREMMKGLNIVVVDCFSMLVVSSVLCLLMKMLVCVMFLGFWEKIVFCVSVVMLVRLIL